MKTLMLAAAIALTITSPAAADQIPHFYVNAWCHVGEVFALPNNPKDDCGDTSVLEIQRGRYFYDNGICYFKSVRNAGKSTTITADCGNGIVKVRLTRLSRQSFDADNAMLPELRSPPVPRPRPIAHTEPGQDMTCRGSLEGPSNFRMVGETCYITDPSALEAVNAACHPEQSCIVRARVVRRDTPTGMPQAYTVLRVYSAHNVSSTGPRR
jgi:hypothetical protein